MLHKTPSSREHGGFGEFEEMRLVMGKQKTEAETVSALCFRF